MKSKKVRNVKSLPRKLITSGAVQTDLHKNRLRSEKKYAASGFPVVAVGFSAGGLEACLNFLKVLRPDTGMAFVFI